MRGIENEAKLVVVQHNLLAPSTFSLYIRSGNPMLMWSLTFDCSPPLKYFWSEFRGWIAEPTRYWSLKTIDAFKDELPLCMMLLNDGMNFPLIHQTELSRSQGFKFRSLVSLLLLMAALIAAIAKLRDEKIGDVKETDIVNRREKMSWMSYGTPAAMKR